MARRDFGPNPVAKAAQSANGKRTIHYATERRRALIRMGRDPRWPTGPSPIKHGASVYYATRCRGENGRACPACLAAVREAVAASRARRRAAAAGLTEVLTQAPESLT